MVLEYVQTKCTHKIICCFWRQKCTAIVKKQENFTTEETETITPTSSLNFFKTGEKKIQGSISCIKFGGFLGFSVLCGCCIETRILKSFPMRTGFSKQSLLE